MITSERSRVIPFLLWHMQRHFRKLSIGFQNLTFRVI